MMQSLRKCKNAKGTSCFCSDGVQTEPLSYPACMCVLKQRISVLPMSKSLLVNETIEQEQGTNIMLPSRLCLIAANDVLLHYSEAM